jgi:hypothetical protein
MCPLTSAWVGIEALHQFANGGFAVSCHATRYALDGPNHFIVKNRHPVVLAFNATFASFNYQIVLDREYGRDTMIYTTVAVIAEMRVDERGSFVIFKQTDNTLMKGGAVQGITG